MDGMLDLERLLGRVALDSAGPREVMALGATLAACPACVRRLGRFEREALGGAGCGHRFPQNFHRRLPRVCPRRYPQALIHRV